MKNNITLIVVLGLVIWNIVLTLQPKEKENDINYELLQEKLKQVERRIDLYELQMNRRNTKIDENKTFIDNATYRELDSLESRLFRR